MEKHRNADGTYNGVAVMADVTGLSQGEIRWMWDRMKALRAEGVSGADAKAIVKAECVGKPWERTP